MKLPPDEYFLFDDPKDCGEILLNKFLNEAIVISTSGVRNSELVDDGSGGRSRRRHGGGDCGDCVYAYDYGLSSIGCDRKIDKKLFVQVRMLKDKLEELDGREMMSNGQHFFSVPHPLPDFFAFELGVLFGFSFYNILDFVLLRQLKKMFFVGAIFSHSGLETKEFDDYDIVNGYDDDTIVYPPSTVRMLRAAFFYGRHLQHHSDLDTFPKDRFFEEEFASGIFLLSLDTGVTQFNIIYKPFEYFERNRLFEECPMCISKMNLCRNCNFKLMRSECWLSTRHLTFSISKLKKLSFDWK